MHPNRRAISDQPFKASESYQAEDRQLFFGREREARRLRSLILAAPISLLHAPSGAGKTSVLNAMVIPALETRGWIVARMTPGTNPIRALRASVLLALVPIPEFEADAVQEVLALCREGGDEEPTLARARERWESLPTRDVRRRQLVAPYEAALDSGAGRGDTGWYVPGFCRVLQDTIDAKTWGERLSMLSAGDASAPRDAERSSSTSIDDQTTLSTLLDWLSQTDRVDAYRRLLNQVDTHAPGLYDFFANVEHELGPWLEDTGLVVILDQFEEVFTLLADPGTGAVRGRRSPSDAAPSYATWPHRRGFFRELERTYEACCGSPQEDDQPIRTSISFVISMRDDYIAQLDDVRRFASDLDRSAFHLTFLARDHADAVIRKPAELFDATFTDDCFDEIRDALSREERFMLPSEVQIVCDKFWREREYAPRESDDSDALVFDLAFLNGHLEGVRSILSSFFGEFLEQFETVEERYECLELLEPLITADGTRNIVEENLLVTAPFADVESRRRILFAANERRIVRIEKRLQQRFVEITHEFIIEPLLDSLRVAFVDDYRYNRFREARRSLARYARTGWLQGAHRELNVSEFEALLEFESRMDWSWWAAQMMLRSAIRLGRSAEEFERAVAIHERIEYPGGELDRDRLFGETATGAPIGITVLRALLDSVAGEIGALSDVRRDFARRSVLGVATEGDSDDIRFWFAG